MTTFMIKKLMFLGKVKGKESEGEVGRGFMISAQFDVACIIPLQWQSTLSSFQSPFPQVRHLLISLHLLF